MKMTYESYCADMENFKQTAMSKEAFNKMQWIGEESQAPLILEPKKDYRKSAASLDNFIKVTESSKRRRAIRISESMPKKIRAVQPPKQSSIERSAQKKLYAQKRAAQYKAAGLTAKGKVPIPRKEGMTKKEMASYKAAKMREQRAIWKDQGLNNQGQPYAAKSKEKLLEYAKTYQAKHREKHLASRKVWREKNKDKINAHRKEVKNNMCTLQEAS